MIWVRFFVLLFIFKIDIPCDNFYKVLIVLTNGVYLGTFYFALKDNKQTKQSLSTLISINTS